MKEFLQTIIKGTRKLLLLSLLSFGSFCFIFGQNIWPQEQTFSISEPQDINFDIDWQMYSSITSVVYYYWDEFDVYQEVIINSGTDYSVSGNILTIYQSYIEGLNPDPGNYLHFYATFDEMQQSHFGIRIVQTYFASIFEDNKNFDLSNPDKVFGTIAWATAYEITSVKVGGSELNSSQYYIQGDWIFFTEEYLSNVLISSGNSITVVVTFDYDYSDNFVINAVQTGVNSASLNPDEFNVNMNGSVGYIESVITWNAASSVESMTVIYAESDSPQEYPYVDYTVTPINASTATLRINLGNKGVTNNTKEMDFFYVSIKVNFNVGISRYIYLSLFSEYYYVDVLTTPWNGGWVEGGSNSYDVDEEVYIEAFPNPNYTFVKYIIDGTTEITENPYTFNMPAHDVSINAVFMSDYPEVLFSNPMQWQNEVNINSSIYLTFNKNIIEGTTNNGFDDITLNYDFGPWAIDDIYIMNGNILVIQPALPLDINTTYNLNIPPESIEDPANPGTIMNGPYMLQFITGWGDFQHGEISPENNIYSLMEPADVVFDIIWGDDESLNTLNFYYWDQFDNYQEHLLIYPTDYVISGDQLIIKNSFISSLTPESGQELNFYGIFESGWNSYFNINVIQTMVPYLIPDEISYDLSNPHDLFTIIMLNTAESITSVSRNSINLTENTDYRIVGDWLFIHNSYLSPLLQTTSDEITLDVSFDTEDVSTLTITTVQTGILDATIDPEFQTIDNDYELDYLDFTVTWNDASLINGIMVYEVNEGELNSFELTDYTVTPINAETSLLRIFMGAKKNSIQTKYTDEFNLFIEIDFNVGANAYSFLTVIDEYYIVYSDVQPANSGYVWGDYEYSVGENVELGAEPNGGYEFLCWKIDGQVVSTDNPYMFEMPANDIYITAHFVPQGATLYTVTLNSNPVDAGVLSGAGQYIVGENVTINANPNTGFEFTNWTNALSEVVTTDNQYSFIMTAENVTFTANFIDVSNINSNSAKEIEVYPNPFSDVLYISNFESISRITITTITGQIVAEYTTLSDGQINTSDLSNGFYMFIIEKTDGVKLIRKIVKQ